MQVRGVFSKSSGGLSALSPADRDSGRSPLSISPIPHLAYSEFGKRGEGRILVGTSLSPNEKGLAPKPSCPPPPLIASNTVIYSFNVFLGCVPIRLSVPMEAGICICREHSWDTAQAL